MSVKIEKKIVSYSLASEEKDVTPAPPVMQQMNEELPRPDVLRGTTYKVKPPVLDTALYITINDYLINEGTDQERYHPFEIFVNSKDMQHFQWIVALTRVMSAVFRKGGDVTFLVEELGSVFDPSGGYFKKGGKFMPSMVAEIAEILKTHLENNGLLEKQGLDEHQQKLVDEKKSEYMQKAASSNEGMNDEGYPKSASLCKKCNTKASIVMDGCLTCLACGDSKCQ